MPPRRASRHRSRPLPRRSACCSFAGRAASCATLSLRASRAIPRSRASDAPLRRRSRRASSYRPTHCSCTRNAPKTSRWPGGCAMRHRGAQSSDVGWEIQAPGLRPAQPAIFRGPLLFRNSYPASGVSLPASSFGRLASSLGQPASGAPQIARLRRRLGVGTAGACGHATTSREIEITRALLRAKAPLRDGDPYFRERGAAFTGNGIANGEREQKRPPA